MTRGSDACTLGCNRAKGAAAVTTDDAPTAAAVALPLRTTADTNMAEQTCLVGYIEAASSSTPQGVQRAADTPSISSSPLAASFTHIADVRTHHRHHCVLRRVKPTVVAYVNLYCCFFCYHE